MAQLGKTRLIRASLSTAASTVAPRSWPIPSRPHLRLAALRRSWWSRVDAALVEERRDTDARRDVIAAHPPPNRSPPWMAASGSVATRRRVRPGLLSPPVAPLRRLIVAGGPIRGWRSSGSRWSVGPPLRFRGFAWTGRRPQQQAHPDRGAPPTAKCARHARCGRGGPPAPPAAGAVALAARLRIPDLDVLWRADIHRFDVERTRRCCKQTLEWTTPRARRPEQAGR